MATVTQKQNVANSPTNSYPVGIFKQADGTELQAVVLVNSTGTEVTLSGGGGGAGTEYTEDVAAAADPVGGALIMVRKDTLAALTSTDGDNVAARGTDKGELYVKHADSLTVTNAGTFITQDSQTLADNGAFTDGTSKVYPAGYIYDEIAGTALTENDAAAARINVNRAVVGTIEDGTTRGRYATVTALNAIKVDGSAVTQTVIQSNRSTSNTMAALNAVVSLSTIAGCATGTLQLSGTWVGTVVLEASTNGTNFVILNLIDYATGAITTSTTVNGAWIVPCGGFKQVQIRMSAYTSGTATGYFEASPGTQAVMLANPIPTGANAIGKLAANSGVDIGDVDITSVVPGVAATSLGKAEDAAHTTGDTGVMALGVRNDAGTTLAGTDGDYIPLSIDASGQLRVTGGGGGTQYTEDIAAAADPVGTVPILVRKDTPSATVTTDGDNIAQRGTNYGAAYVTLLDTSGSAVSVGGGTQYDEDTAHVSGDKLTLAGVVRKDTPVTLCDTDGDRTALIVDSAGRLHCQVSNTLTVGSHAVTNAGTFAVQVDGASLTSLQLIDDIVYTDDTSTHATGTSKGALFMAAATPTDSAVNANDIGAVAMTVDRKLHVSVQDALPAGANAIGKLAANAGVTIGAVEIAAAQTLGTVTTVSTVSTITNVVHVDDNAGSITVDNGGTFAVQATIASGATSIAKAEDVLSADADVGVPAMAVRKATPANTSGTDGDYEFLQISAGRLWASATIDAALPAGTNGIGKLTANSGVTIGAVEIAASQTLAATQSGTWTVQPGNTANTTPWLVTDSPATSGGLTTHHAVAAATTNATNVKASAGQLYGYYIYNSNAAARKVAFHNTAGTPTAGASIFFSVVIPPSSGANVEFGKGIPFSTGIGYTTVTGLADTDSAAVALNDLVINLFYK